MHEMILTEMHVNSHRLEYIVHKNLMCFQCFKHELYKIKDAEWMVNVYIGESTCTSIVYTVLCIKALYGKFYF